MIKIKEIQEKAKPGTFFKKLMEGIIKPSEEGATPEYCPFCFKEKHEFISPLTNRITLLLCECEKYFYMLKEFIQFNQTADAEVKAKIQLEYDRMVDLKARNSYQQKGGNNA